MPLYEYKCRGCGRQFEYLTRSDRTPSCPSCQGDNLQKLLSVCSVRTKAGGLPQDVVVPFDDGGHGNCGTYGSGHGSGDN